VVYTSLNDTPCSNVNLQVQRMLIDTVSDRVIDGIGLARMLPEFGEMRFESEEPYLCHSWFIMLA